MRAVLAKLGEEAVGGLKKDEPAIVRAMVAVSRVASLQGAAQEARELGMKAVEDASAADLLGVAVTLALQGEHDAVGELVARASEKQSPGAIGAWLDLAAVLRVNGRLELALDVAEKALARVDAQHDNVQALLEIARTLARQGDLHGALERAKKALNLALRAPEHEAGDDQPGADASIS